MGLDRCFIRFLLGAKAAGVDFKRTAMIGRQVFTPDVTAPWLAAVLSDHGCRADASSLLAAEGQYTEAFWPLLGAAAVDSVDANTYEGASLIHDLNEPIGDPLKRRFTAVVDGGTIEHVFNVPQAIKNCMEMVEPSGHYLCVTVANSLLGHGFYQFSPEWAYRVFARENGFSIRSVMICEVCIANPRFYRVDDPASVGGRIELASGTPAYLLVLARRVEAVPIFRRVPQQSDYFAAWTGQTGGVPAPPANGSPPPQAPAGGATPATPARAPGKSRRLPAFLKWDSRLRRGMRRLGAAPGELLRGIFGAGRRSWNGLRRRLRTVNPANELGLKARYFHPISYEDLRAGRITSDDGR